MVNICLTFFVHKIASIQRIRYKLIDADQEKQFIDTDQERRFCSQMIFLKYKAKIDGSFAHFSKPNQLQFFRCRYSYSN